MRAAVAQRPAAALFAFALAAAGALLAHYQSPLTFWRDEWDFLLHHSELSADSILSPHLEHVAVLN